MTEKPTIAYALLGLVPGETSSGQRVIVSTIGFDRDNFAEAVSNQFFTRREAKLSEGDWEWFGAVFRDDALYVVRDTFGLCDHKGRPIAWTQYFFISHWWGTLAEVYSLLFSNPDIEPPEEAVFRATLPSSQLPNWYEVSLTVAAKRLGVRGSRRLCYHVFTVHRERFRLTCARSLFEPVKSVELLRSDPSTSAPEPRDMVVVSLDELNFNLQAAPTELDDCGVSGVKLPIATVRVDPKAMEESTGAAGVEERGSDSAQTVLEGVWLKEVIPYLSEIRKAMMEVSPWERLRAKRVIGAIESLRKESAVVLRSAGDLSKVEAASVGSLWLLWCMFNIELRWKNLLRDFEEEVERRIAHDGSEEAWANLFMFGDIYRSRGFVREKQFVTSELVEFQKVVAEAVLELSFRRTVGGHKIDANGGSNYRN